MPMPETAVNKNNLMPRLKNQIGLSRQVGDVQSIPKAHCEDHFTNQKLRF